MKISEKQLRNIIKESIQGILREYNDLSQSDWDYLVHNAYDGDYQGKSEKVYNIEQDLKELNKEWSKIKQENHERIIKIIKSWGLRVKILLPGDDFQRGEPYIRIKDNDLIMSGYELICRNTGLSEDMVVNLLRKSGFDFVGTGDLNAPDIIFTDDKIKKEKKLYSDIDWKEGQLRGIRPLD
jgi:hypothetical protein